MVFPVAFSAYRSTPVWFWYQNCRPHLPSKFWARFQCNNADIIFCRDHLSNTLFCRKSHQLQCIGILAAISQNKILKLMENGLRQSLISSNFFIRNKRIIFFDLIKRVHSIPRFPLHLKWNDRIQCHQMQHS